MLGEASQEPAHPQTSRFIGAGTSRVLSTADLGGGWTAGSRTHWKLPEMAGLSAAVPKREDPRARRASGDGRDGLEVGLGTAGMGTACHDGPQNAPGSRGT